MMLLKAISLIWIAIVPASALQNQERERGACSVQPESFALKKRNLQVWNAGDGVLFTSGMTIDADGAPNAYGPKNRGLDFTANARGRHGWVALVTNKQGHPVRQKRGPYRGFYVSTTSLEQRSITDLTNPKRYIDARKVPYIALPRDFADRFGIGLGDLAVVMNQANGRSAYAIFADIGPRGKIGEGSIALAKALGMPADPRHSLAPDGIVYLVFPGSGAAKWKSVTVDRIKLSARRLYRQW